MISVLFTMRHDKRTVFIPAIITMVGLHLFSVSLGLVFPLLFSQRVIVYLSVIVFMIFGILMFKDSYYAEDKSSKDKLDELAGELLEKKEGEGEGQEPNKPKPDTELKSVEAGTSKAANGHAGNLGSTPEPAPIASSSSPSKPDQVLPIEEAAEKSYLDQHPSLQLMFLLFVGECGDRTQLAAIALTTTHEVWGVAIGGAIVTSLEIV
jgi:putative Ca2+/H+ antiporter (TMEM165/GDT1 family)